MRNSAARSITENVCPWLLTNHAPVTSGDSLEGEIQPVELLLLLPLPQRPLRRAVNAGVQVIAVELEQRRSDDSVLDRLP